MKKKRSLLFVPVLLLVILHLNGCVSHEELLNFNTGHPFPDSLQIIQNLPELKIQSNDLLTIKVRVYDAETAIPYNLELDNSTGIAAQQGAVTSLGYLVDKEGFIDFPQLGRMKAAGKTTKELKKEIEEALKPYLNNPMVVVRYFNFRITLLGEVNRPGTYTMPTERASILDAIGQAGDMTVFASRNNILLIREQGGNRQFIRLNLQDREIFNSPYFYLVQNDVIYIEPKEIKTVGIQNKSQQITPWVSVVGTAVSLIIAIISLTKK